MFCLRLIFYTQQHLQESDSFPPLTKQWHISYHSCTLSEDAIKHNLILGFGRCILNSCN